MTTPGPPAPAGTDAALRLLAELRAEIGRADQKAAILVGAQSMTAGLLAGLLAARGWHTGRLPAPAAIAWWTGTATFAGSLGALMMVILPRYRASGWTPGRPLTYFGDIRRAAAQGHLLQGLADTSRDPLSGLTESVAAAGRIAARKHGWIRIGLAAYGAAALLVPLSLLAR